MLAGDTLMDYYIAGPGEVSKRVSELPWGTEFVLKEYGTECMIHKNGGTWQQNFATYYKYYRVADRI